MLSATRPRSSGAPSPVPELTYLLGKVPGGLTPTRRDHRYREAIERTVNTVQIPKVCFYPYCCAQQLFLDLQGTRSDWHGNFWLSVNIMR